MRSKVVVQSILKQWLADVEKFREEVSDSDAKALRQIDEIKERIMCLTEGSVELLEKDVVI